MTERENGTAEAATADVFPLDDALIALLAEYAQRALALDAERRGALVLFLRQHGLTGQWQLAPNGRELVRSGGEG
jgi:hypothetical protein